MAAMTAPPTRPRGRVMSANGGRGLVDAACTAVTTNFSRGAACASAGVLLGPRGARGLGEVHVAVDVHAGERVPGQNFDCYAVRSGLKRGVFMNWADVLAQTTGYKGKSVRRQRRWQQ